MSKNRISENSPILKIKNSVNELNGILDIAKREIGKLKDRFKEIGQNAPNQNKTEDRNNESL